MAKRERRLLTVGKEMSWAEQVKEHSYSRPLKKKKKHFNKMEEKREKKRNAYRYLGRRDEKSALHFLDHTAKKTGRHPQFKGPHEYMFLNRDLHLGRKGGVDGMGRHTTTRRVTPEKKKAVYSVEADGFTGSHNKASGLYARASGAPKP